MNRLPQWSVEGMAEYLSIGRDDPNTVMFLRDAALRNKLPTFKKLVTDPQGCFAYRWGQALYAYIGGKYGDVQIPAIYRAALRRGIDPAIREVLGITPDSLMKAWLASIKKDYLADAKTRTLPKDLGTRVLTQASKKYGDLDVVPSLSPDGKEVAFVTSRGLFNLYLYIADAATGRIIHKLTNPNGDPHFEAVNFVSSSGAWSPDGKCFAIAAYVGGASDIIIYDEKSGHQAKRIRIPGIGMINSIGWGPDGQIAFSGMANGLTNLFVYHLETGKTDKLTEGRYARLEPVWSPDGRSLAYVTDSAPATNFDQLVYAPMQIAIMDMTSPTHATRVLPLFGGESKNINPQYTPDLPGAVLHLRRGRLLGRLSDRPGQWPDLPCDASRDGYHGHPAGPCEQRGIARDDGGAAQRTDDGERVRADRIRDAAVEPEQFLSIPTPPIAADSAGGTAIAQGSCRRRIHRPGMPSRSGSRIRRRALPSERSSRIRRTRRARRSMASGRRAWASHSAARRERARRAVWRSSSAMSWRTTSSPRRSRPRVSAGHRRRGRVRESDPQMELRRGVVAHPVSAGGRNSI